MKIRFYEVEEKNSFERCDKNETIRFYTFETLLSKILLLLLQMCKLGLPYWLVSSVSKIACYIFGGLISLEVSCS